MLPIQIFSKCLRAQIQSQHKWIGVTVKMSFASDSSSGSSSDSSSDSDSEIAEQKQNIGKPEDTKSTQQSAKEAAFEALIQRMTQKVQSTKQFDITVRPKRKDGKTGRVPGSGKSFSEQLIKAAENVANLESNKDEAEKTKSQLLGKLIDPDQKENDASPASIMSSMLANRTKNIKVTQKKEKSGWQGKQSVLYQLAQEQKWQSKYDGRNKEQPSFREQEVDLSKLKQIFSDVQNPEENLPELKTWDALRARELQLSITTHPTNVFQELIQWTENGLLWNFPIDNEQGMEKEQNVHFSNHVFLERHLKGWCPSKGPVRHFMELVCTGLSKNPYMTVEEKVEHIMWYKEYFAQKEQMLRDLGALGTEQPNKAKQIAAEQA